MPVLLDLVFPMRATFLGLTVPLILLAAAFVSVPLAAAQDTTTYTISGRVVSDEGIPLEGVLVNGYTYHEDATRSSVGSNDDAVTDENGAYTLTLAAGKGWINVYYESWRQSTGREIAVDGDTDGLDFTLATPPPKTARIEGTVVDANGEPIEGADVTLQYMCCYAMEDVAYAEGGSGEGSDGVATSSTRPAIMPYPYPSHDDSNTTRTDADGKFAFDAYGGPRQITAYAKGYAQTTVQITAVENKTADVEVELLKVPDRDAILEGRIVDSATGLPLANAQVNARSLEWGRYAYATTDKDGHYRIQTVPGWTEISVSYWPSYAEPVPLTDEKIAAPRSLQQQYFPYTTMVDLDSGDNELGVDLDPKPQPTIALIGYVVDPTTKKAVSGAHVSVWNQETGDWGEATTDATGSYKILVRAGHYTANVWKEGHLGGSQSFVLDDDLTQRQDLILPKGEARWAPCYDDTDCGGPIMYAEKGYAMDGTATPAAAPAPAMMSSTAGSAGSTTEPATRTATEEAAATDSDSRSATFTGSGGGLPEYDPGDTSSIPAAKNEQTIQVPGAGLLIGIAALAGAAIAHARRK